MPWAKLDDTFHSHPKVRRAGLEALGLHVRAISYSAAYSTDGHVDYQLVIDIAGKRGQKLASALVDAGLWEVNGNGWLIHDYLEFNMSRAQLAQEREARQAAGRRGAEARWSSAA